jgi:hypothetical protein
MERPEDDAGGDESKDYCFHCARPDGSMQSYEEKLDSMAAFVVRVEGRKEDAARKNARQRLSQQPAWRGARTSNSPDRYDEREEGGPVGPPSGFPTSAARYHSSE